MLLNKLCDLSESQVTCKNYIYIYFLHVLLYFLCVGGHVRATEHMWKNSLQESVLLRFADLVASPLVAEPSHQTCFCFSSQGFTVWSSLALNNDLLPQPPDSRCFSHLRQAHLGDALP